MGTYFRSILHVVKGKGKSKVFPVYN